MNLILTNLIFLATLSGACSEKKDTKKFDAVQDTTATGDDVTAEEAEANAQVVADDGFYTGFDGVNEFALLMPGFQTYTANDPSAVKIEQLSVKLSETTISELLAAESEKNPDFEEARFRKAMERERKAYRFTPLKAGTTTISVSGGRGERKKGGTSTWKKGETVKLHITAYPPGTLESGKARYTRDGSDTSRPCKSCHETGQSGAPPHELGRVMEISDKSVKQWITTGKYAGRVAKIPHAWTFASEAEQTGIVAYLRSKQTNDIEALTKLEIEDQIENGGFRPGPGGRPSGDAPPSP